MKYEYDLKKLIADNEHTDVESAYREMLNTQALLAIAERLEALVEAQKPRWVEFEWYTEEPSGGKFAIDTNKVDGVSEIYSNGVFSQCVISLTSDAAYYVKLPLADVMAKLRGGQ